MGIINKIITTCAVLGVKKIKNGGRTLTSSKDMESWDAWVERALRESECKRDLNSSLSSGANCSDNLSFISVPSTCMD